MAKQNQKYIDMVYQIVTPLVLKQDEKAIESINNNFSKQQLVNQVNSKKALEKHEELRQAFKQRHLQNYLYEKQLICQKSNPQLNQFQQKELSINQQELEKLNDPDYFPCRFKKSETIINKTRNLSETQQDNYMAKLSKPKEYCFPEAILHQHSDYKGLLIGELDLRKASQTDNCFVKTVLPSQVAQQALQEQQLNLQNTRRPKTALTSLNLKTKTSFYKLKDLVIPTKTLDDFNKEHKDNEREKILQDIDDFDKNCKKNRKGQVFAKSAFLDAQNSINSDNIKIIKEQRMMRENIKNNLLQQESQQENQQE